MAIERDMVQINGIGWRVLAADIEDDDSATLKLELPDDRGLMTLRLGGDVLAQILPYCTFCDPDLNYEPGEGS